MARVAVVGAGPCGLMALKTFLDDGFDATLYERRDAVGGLWKYSTDDYISVADNTEFNSSKYRSAISDFAMPDDMNDFPTAKQLCKYFHDYCDHFGLWPHIKLRHSVKKMRYLDSSSDGCVGKDTAESSSQRAVGERWVLSIANGEVDSDERFHKVAIATGPWTRPKELHVKGLDEFPGRVVHAMDFHNPSEYAGNTLVIGLSASAQDIVSGLPGHASKVYLSHRSKLALIPRYTPDHSVGDRGPPLGQFIWRVYLSVWLPNYYQKKIDTGVKTFSKTAYPDIPASWGLDPAPSVCISPPLVAHQLWPHLKSGFCKIVPEVVRVDGNGTAELASGELLHNISSIINCTGYDQDVPIEFEPCEAHPYHGEGFRPYYFQNAIPIHPDANFRHSLALLGHGSIFHAGFVRFEIQAMAVSQIWLGNSSLPSHKDMVAWQNMRMAWREKTTQRYGSKSTFYTLYLPFADHAVWLDKTAGCGIQDHFGLVERWTNLCAWKLWWNDRALWNQCLYGLQSPALFRLFETGKRKSWSGAAEQLRLDNEKVEQAQQRRKQAEEKLMK